MIRSDTLGLLSLLLVAAGCGCDEEVIVATPSACFADTDGDGFGDRHESLAASPCPDGYVANDLDCDDTDALTYPDTSGTTDWVLGTCESWARGGAFEALSGGAAAQLFTSLGSTATVSDWTAGCSGSGVQVDHELVAECNGDSCQSWVVLRWEFGERNIADQDFMLLPVLGTAGAGPQSFDIKLGDDDCLVQLTYTEMTDIPVHRNVIIPLEMFTTAAQCELNLDRITAFELGIADATPIEGETVEGTVWIDTPSTATADDLRIEQTHFDCPVFDEPLMHRVAGALIDLQEPHGLVPSWLDGQTMQPEEAMWVYSEASTLCFLSLAAEEFGDPAYLEAATAMANALVSIQRADGSWVDSYRWDETLGALVEDSTTTWEGNTAWPGQCLSVFIEHTGAGDAAHEQAVAMASDWLLGRMDAYETLTGLPGGVTFGSEGNISTALHFYAANEDANAQLVIDYLDANVWDAELGYWWMGLDDPGIALDLFTWGIAVLRLQGRDAEALEALSLAQGLFPAHSFDGLLGGLSDFPAFQGAHEFEAQWLGAGGGSAWYLHDQFLAAEVDIDGDAVGDGLFRGSESDFGGGAGWQTSMVGTSPTAHVGMQAFQHLLGF
jgi:hypothetical protein